MSCRLRPAGSSTDHSAHGIATRPELDEERPQPSLAPSRGAARRRTGRNPVEDAGQRAEAVRLVRERGRRAIEEEPEDTRDDRGHVAAHDDHPSRRGPRRGPFESRPAGRRTAPDRRPGGPGWSRPAAASGRRRSAGRNDHDDLVDEVDQRADREVEEGHALDPDLPACHCRIVAKRRRPGRFPRSSGHRSDRSSRSGPTEPGGQCRARTGPMTLGVRRRIPRRSRSSRIAMTYFRLVPVASRSAAGASGPASGQLQGRPGERAVGRGGVGQVVLDPDDPAARLERPDSLGWTAGFASGDREGRRGRAWPGRASSRSIAARTAGLGPTARPGR